MDLGLVASYLVLRRQLRSPERWSSERLRDHQRDALLELRAHAMARSPFYQRFHAGLGARPLADLPVPTKRELMTSFDDVVTDRDIRLADVEAHLGQIVWDVRFRGRYRVVSTSGTTGLRGIFLSNPTEWAHVVASYARV